MGVGFKNNGFFAKVISIAVICSFILSDVSAVAQYAPARGAGHTLSPSSRFSPIVRIEWKDGRYVVVEDAWQAGELDRTRESFREDAAFLYLGEIIAQALELDLSVRGTKKLIEKHFRKVFSPQDFKKLKERFKWNRLYRADGDLCLPYTGKADGLTCTLRYSLPADGTADGGVTIPFGDGGSNAVLRVIPPSVSKNVRDALALLMTRAKDADRRFGQSRPFLRDNSAVRMVPTAYLTNPENVSLPKPKDLRKIYREHDRYIDRLKRRIENDPPPAEDDFGLDPIKIEVKEDGAVWIMGGVHRLEAFRRLGVKFVPAHVIYPRKDYEGNLPFIDVKNETIVPEEMRSDDAEEDRAEDHPRPSPEGSDDIRDDIRRMNGKDLETISRFRAKIEELFSIVKRVGAIRVISFFEDEFKGFDLATAGMVHPLDIAAQAVERIHAIISRKFERLPEVLPALMDAAKDVGLHADTRGQLVAILRDYRAQPFLNGEDILALYLGGMREVSVRDGIEPLKAAFEEAGEGVTEVRVEGLSAGRLREMAAFMAQVAKPKQCETALCRFDRGGRTVWFFYKGKSKANSVLPLITNMFPTRVREVHTHISGRKPSGDFGSGGDRAWVRKKRSYSSILVEEKGVIYFIVFDATGVIYESRTTGEALKAFETYFSMPHVDFMKKIRQLRDGPDPGENDKGKPFGLPGDNLPRYSQLEIDAPGRIDISLRQFENLLSCLERGDAKALSRMIFKGESAGAIKRGFVALAERLAQVSMMDRREILELLRGRQNSSDEVDTISIECARSKPGEEGKKPLPRASARYYVKSEKRVAIVFDEQFFNAMLGDEHAAAKADILAERLAHELCHDNIKKHELSEKSEESRVICVVDVPLYRALRRMRGRRQAIEDFRKLPGVSEAMHHSGAYFIKLEAWAAVRGQSQTIDRVATFIFDHLVISPEGKGFPAASRPGRESLNTRISRYRGSIDEGRSNEVTLTMITRHVDFCETDLKALAAEGGRCAEFFAWVRKKQANEQERYRAVLDRFEPISVAGEPRYSCEVDGRTEYFEDLLDLVEATKDDNILNELRNTVTYHTKIFPELAIQRQIAMNVLDDMTIRFLQRFVPESNAFLYGGKTVKSMIRLGRVRNPRFPDRRLPDMGLCDTIAQIIKWSRADMTQLSRSADRAHEIYLAMSAMSRNRNFRLDMQNASITIQGETFTNFRDLVGAFAWPSERYMRRYLSMRRKRDLGKTGANKEEIGRRYARAIEAINVMAQRTKALEKPGEKGRNTNTPAGCIRSVFEYLLTREEGAFFDAAQIADGLRQQHGLERFSPASVERDLRALLHHLRLIESTTGDAGRDARFFVPESVRNRLEEGSGRALMLHTLDQFRGENLRPNADLLDGIYENEIRSILEGDSAGGAASLLGDRTRIDMRPVSSGLLDPKFVSYNMTIKNVINPGNADVVAVYGGSGSDWSNFILSTNANEAYFVGRPSIDHATLQHCLDHEWERYLVDGSFMEQSGLAASRKRKFEAGYNLSSELSEQGGIESMIMLELKCMGVRKFSPDGNRNIEITENDDGSITISFTWRYAGQKRRKYSITFIKAQLQDPGTYPERLKDVLRRGIDVYYQRAAMETPVRYEHFLPYIASSVKDSGYLVTEDHIPSDREYNPDSLLALAENATGAFTQKGEVLSADMERWEQVIKSRTGTRDYGWHVNIRQKKVPGTLLRQIILCPEKNHAIQGKAIEEIVERIAREHGFLEEERSRLTDLVRELTTNIMEFTPGGSIRILEGRREDGRTALELIGRDAGPGIEDPEALRIRSARTVPSRGLGFWHFSRSADEAVVESAGRQWVKDAWNEFQRKGRSDVLEGSRITLTVYLRDSRGNIVEAPPRADTPKTDPAERGGERIDFSGKVLTVDDLENGPGAVLASAIQAAVPRASEPDESERVEMLEQYSEAASYQVREAGGKKVIDISTATAAVLSYDDNYAIGTGKTFLCSAGIVKYTLGGKRYIAAIHTLPVGRIQKFIDLLTELEGKGAGDIGILAFISEDEESYVEPMVRAKINAMKNVSSAKLFRKSSGATGYVYADWDSIYVVEHPGANIMKRVKAGTLHWQDVNDPDASGGDKLPRRAHDISELEKGQWVRIRRTHAATGEEIYTREMRVENVSPKEKKVTLRAETSSGYQLSEFSYSYFDAEKDSAIRDEITILEESAEKKSVDDLLDTIKIRAREAGQKGQKLIVGVGTSWIPGYGDQGSGQYMALNPIFTELRNGYFSNVVFVDSPDTGLAQALRKKAAEMGTSYENIMALAGEDTVSGKDFKEFRDENSFLMGVDTCNFKNLGYTPHVWILDMIYVMMAVAGDDPLLDDEEADSLYPLLGFKRKGAKRGIFEPEADRMDIEKYRRELTFLESA